jgi:hypothetical protein
MESPRLTIIGRRERIDFPEWHLKQVRVKVDTGARTTALGVSDLEIIDKKPSGKVALFRPLIKRKGGMCEARVIRMTRVRNSGGLVELRPVIETEIRLGPVRKWIQITLTDRSRMKTAVLLGRSALAGDFVVDVSKRDLLRGS